jgi:hypothetical protein
MKVELIYDADCPNVQTARTQLLRAFGIVGVDAVWTEWDRASEGSPEHVRRYGSPTILVDGEDVVPEDPAAASCCRLYLDRAGVMGRVPALERIVSALGGSSAQSEALQRSRSSMPAWKTTLGAAPSVGVALLPKLTCAACWPAYAALMSAFGFGFFDYTAYLLPITAVALALTLATIAWRARTRRGYGPLAVGVVATALHLVGKFVLESDAIAYAAVPILICAAVWNAWPRKVAGGSCSACPST